mmetsp:Transcript_65065/g.153083  ORF Transcript_65065/g.153083 Transcript_65065/m.153083 type:complete len:856 (+) Transcript_65065:22-2589(+)
MVAMQNMPGTGYLHMNYGQVLPKGTTQASGDWRAAAEKCFEVLSIEPDNFHGHLHLGSLFLAAGDYARALDHSEKAYKIDQRSIEAMSNIGAVCRQQGNYQAAADWYRAALRINPNCETTPLNLAVCLINHGLQIKASDPKGAIRCYREALVHCPTNANAYYNLGVSYAEMQKYDKALISYQLTVHFDPRCAEAYNNMGVIYKEQENLEKALKYYHLAIQCNPRFAQTLNNLGVAYTTSGRLTEALEYLSRAVAVAPTYAEAYNNLGWLFWDHGDLAQALRMYERCIELSPTSKNPSQNRLLALNYLHGVSPELVFQAHSAWAERFCREVGVPFTSWANSKIPGRQLKIGYISPDFFHHSVSFFCHALLEHRNTDQFDVFIYNNASREDDKTELFKSLVPGDRWKKVTGMAAHEVAEMIREDQIDILIELAGHTANNRLDVIALKPAPVQITYIGYNNTTGLGTLDYRLVDEVVDPIDSPQPFSEELVRIPGCFLCYTPPSRMPDVEPLPALRNGYVTFGSFSCLAKVGEAVVALWARCLHEVPNSKLLVKNKGFYSQDVQATFINKFKAYGIPEHRLKLMALAPTSYEHLNIYNEVDIALDTFPYSNTTTTCESLLMGVPAVCQIGNTHGSRVCHTLLTAIGLAEFSAHTQEEYVTKVKGVASNLQALAMLRKNLRQIMLSSPLCDGPGFVRDKYEPILREKWLAYCNGRPPSQQVFSSSEPPDPLSPGPFAPPLPPGQPFVQGPAQAPAVPQASSMPAVHGSIVMGTGTVMPAMLTSPSQFPQHGSLSIAGVPTTAHEAMPMSPVASLRPVTGAVWHVTEPGVFNAITCAPQGGVATRHRRSRHPRLHPGRRA